MKYMISAGEASGDLHASRLIKALKELDNDASFQFLGGRRSELEAGIKPLIGLDEMSVMGFGEVVRKLPQIAGHLRKAKEYIANWRPDALVLVDYPSFNLKLAKYAHKIGVKVYWYISPKVWVWKEYRVKALKKYVDRLFCILPFEVEYFNKRHNWKVDYVGNPSVEEVNTHVGNDLRTIHNISKPLLALLPGSRLKEITTNLPIMVEVASRMKDYDALIAAVPEVSPDIYNRFCGNIPLVYNDTYNLLHSAQAALVTSGTATLETALMKIPQVMLYRHSGSKTVYKLFRRLLKVPYFSLPNLILNNEVISELVMHFCTPESVHQKLLEVIEGGSQYERQQRDYDRMIELLGTGHPSEKVAAQIFNSIKS